MITDNHGTKITTSEMVDDTRKFKLTTYKYNEQIISTASCCTQKDGWETFALYSDFMVTVKISSHKRITVSMVAAQHEEAMKLYEWAKSKAVQHYKDKELRTV